MLTLLCGPSSSGKSTIYTSGTLARYLGMDTLPAIKFAYEFDGDGNPLAQGSPADCIVHYNMMRPLEALRTMGQRPMSELYDRWSFSLDLAWSKIVSLPGPKQALVLVASKDVLLDRVSARRDIEPDLVAKDGAYDFGYWRDVYTHANLPLVYSLFVRELESHGIQCRFIASRDQGFEEIDAESIFGELTNARRTRYTAEQIVELTKPPTFEYQAVRLPHGLATKGHNRSATCELILPQNLNGASVLDIGSALGAVCFEAEKRGAAEVVGLEPRESRFEAAVILKEILGSGVEIRRETLAEFLHGQLLARTSRRQFDHVLLLNVIHHLDNPIEALRQCALLTKRQLVIEFPTLDDPIFAGVPPELAEAVNRLALMGVSTRSADQRFLFTQTALERILLDHQRLFKNARFVPSPMEGGRVIGIFEK